MKTYQKHGVEKIKQTCMKHRSWNTSKNDAYQTAANNSKNTLQISLTSVLKDEDISRLVFLGHPWLPKPLLGIKNWNPNN
jgi:hypothetical protein